MDEKLTAIGLMSGTSMDGVDAALIKSDGNEVERIDSFVTIPYTDAFRERLRETVGSGNKDKSVEEELTIIHNNAVKALLEESRLDKDDIDIIGFHGHTIKHDPDNSVTMQIGEGPLLAKLTGIDVVNDFRTKDVLAGGQGAPLVPLYHAALARDLDKPVAFLNIGGVANITYIGSNNDEDIISFDTGPGNALINDLVYKEKGLLMDEGGKIAESGKVNEKVLAALLKDEYFRKFPPKSLDRDQFDVEKISNLSFKDGVATLTAFTIQSVIESCVHLPQPPNSWYVAGGGRNNTFILDQLRSKIVSVNPLAKIEPIEKLNLNGDALEAEAFAYLAIRTMKNLTITLPNTTGRKSPKESEGASEIGGIICLT